MVRLSVIIVTYNCFDLLKKCLESVFRHNDIGDELEVIVVDNGEDGSCERIRAVPGFERVMALKHENTGYGAGNNAGAALSGGDVLLFLNPDTEIIEPVFRFALDKFDSDPKLGCFGVQLLDKELKRAPSAGFRLHMGFLKVQTFNLLEKIGVFLPESMFTSGADLFVRRSDFYDCGAFDENIFMYCEEADICNRLNGIGKNAAFFPEKHIIHNEGSTSAASFPQKYAVILGSRKYYCSKYGIDFRKEAKKELRYCFMKAFILKILGRVDASEAYREVTEVIKNVLSDHV